jgi:hypothetical protein
MSLQQLGSSGRAVLRKRDENHAQKGFVQVPNATVENTSRKRVKVDKTVLIRRNLLDKESWRYLYLLSIIYRAVVSKTSLFNRILP